MAGQSGGPLSRPPETAHTGAVPDDDDRPRDASGAAGAGWSDHEPLNTAWFELTAPDDISELDRDIHAYHRELRAARRRERFERVWTSRAARPVTLLVAVMAVAAVVASLLTILGSNHPAKAPTQLPLARTSDAAGERSGLLPAVELRRATDRTTVGARSLRPGIIALLPSHCACTARLVAVAHELAATQVRFYVIAPTDPDAEVAALAGPLRSDSLFYDQNDDLAAAVGAHGLTLVTVDRDGTIFDIQPNAGALPRGELAATVEEMLQPGAGG
jgi:hypothetical protein